MSSALAIGAVSAVVRNLLDNGMIEAGPAVGTVKVTAVAPDTIKLDDPAAGPSLAASPGKSAGGGESGSPTSASSGSSAFQKRGISRPRSAQ